MTSAQPPAEWEHRITHTYREVDISGNNVLGFMTLAVLCLGVPVGVVVVHALGTGVTRDDLGSIGWVITFVCGIWFFGYLWHHYRSCAEIRLSDEGMCELETGRRVIRLHVSQIQAVKYHAGDDDEYYTIHYRNDGKLTVSHRMTDFRDFLARLKAGNPAVDLTSFPAEAWPDLSTEAERSSTAVSRFFRSAIFPLLVIAFIVVLAVETLGGK